MTEEVFRVISNTGQSPHWDYAAGISKLSRSFCTLTSRTDLLRTAELRPALDRAYEPATSGGDRGSPEAGGGPGDLAALNTA